MFNNNDIYQVLCDKWYTEWKLKLQVEQHMRLNTLDNGGAHDRTSGSDSNSCT
jgi:hypothetical protein